MAVAERGMRKNLAKYHGQKSAPRRTLRSGRGGRTNSNTSRQIPARVIDAAYDTLPPTSAPKPARNPPCSRPELSGLLFPPILHLFFVHRPPHQLHVDYRPI